MELNKKNVRGKLYDLQSQIKGLAGLVESDVLKPDQVIDAVARITTSVFADIDETPSET